MNLGLPIFLGYLPVGAAFGLLADPAGFTPLQAIACSALVLAGAGQLVALSLVRDGAGVVAVLVTTAVINLRYLLFSASLSPRLRWAPVWQQAGLGFFLTDETFAVNSAGPTGARADVVTVLGVGVVAWTGWVLGTTAGALGGALIGDPSTWGVDFAMAAMFTALLVGQTKDRRDLAVAIVAVGLTVVFMLALPGRWFVVLASVLAAGVGAVVFRTPAEDASEEPR